jgi:hypothetical protein
LEKAENQYVYKKTISFEEKSVLYKCAVAVEIWRKLETAGEASPKLKTFFRPAENFFGRGVTGSFNICAPPNAQLRFLTYFEGPSARVFWAFDHP